MGYIPFHTNGSLEAWKETGTGFLKWTHAEIGPPLIYVVCSYALLGQYEALGTHIGGFSGGI